MEVVRSICEFRPRPSGELRLGSEFDHHLDGLTVVHRTVAVGDTVDVRDAIEHPPRLNPALEHVGQELLSCAPYITVACVWGSFIRPGR